MKMPRSLHVVPTYFPAVRYGGPIQSVHGLCRSLVELGGEVHVFTTNVDGAGVSPVELRRPIDVDGVKVWYFPTGFGRRLYRSPEMGAALEGRIASFDILHLHSAFLWPTTMAARIARKRGIPYLLAPRGMLVEALIRKKSRLEKSAWIAAFERANVAGAAAVHVTSKIERAEIEKLGLRARSYALVPNGVDLPPLPAPSSGGARPYVLSLGRINWKKGVDRLITAMTYAPGADLVVAGNDEEGYTSKLKEIVSRLALSNRVRFVGEVHGERKLALLRDCAIFALASYSENFGNVVLEAMACGRPVLVTPEVGLADEVRISGAGIVVVGEPAALGQAIAALLGNSSQRASCAIAARGAAEKYSWPAVARQMEAAYCAAVKITP